MATVISECDDADTNNGEDCSCDYGGDDGGRDNSHDDDNNRNYYTTFGFEFVCIYFAHLFPYTNHCIPLKYPFILLSCSCLKKDKNSEMFLAN